MSFKGDLSTIGLAEVFQMISMSQKEGTLVVMDSESRKAIYFGSDGVQLHSAGKRKGFRIGDILVRAGKITVNQLREVLDEQQGTRRMLGEELVGRGLVTEQEIQDVVRSQIEEEIYDLFLWRKANFEFIEGPPIDELQDPETRAIRLAFDVNSLLLEAVRRTDEWTLINQKIPSMDCIHAWASGSAREEEDASAGEINRTIFQYIDGQSTVAEIIDQSFVPRFEVCKIIVDLLDRGRISLLAPVEMVAVARRRLEEGNRDRGLKLFGVAAQLAPEDTDLIGKYAHALETEGMIQEAARMYVRVGALLKQQGEGKDALAYFQRAVSLNPDDMQSKIALFEVNLATASIEEAMGTASELIQTCLRENDQDTAREIAEQAVAAAPQILEMRVLLAKVYQQLGLKKERDDVVLFLRKNLPVDQKQADRIIAELRELSDKSEVTPRAPAASGSRRRRARGVSFRRIALVLAPVVLVAIVGAAVWYEMRSRDELQACIQKADIRARNEQWAEARLQLNEWKNSPWNLSPFVRWQLKAAHSDLDRRELAATHRGTTTMSAEDLRKIEEETKRRAAELAQAERMLQELKILDSTARYDEALLLSNDLVSLADRLGASAILRQARPFGERLAPIDRQVRTLRADADRLEAEGRFKDACDVIETLHTTHPFWKLAQQSKFPFGIEARPAGVRVYMRAGTQAWPREPVGTSKDEWMVLRLPWGHGKFHLRFEKDGFKSQEITITDERVGEARVWLSDRIAKETFPLGAALLSDPVIAEGQMCLLLDGGSTTGSRVHAVELNRKLRWEERADTPPRAGPGGLMYVGRGASLVGIDGRKPDDRRVAWEFAGEEQVTTPCAFSAAGDVAFFGAGNKLVAVGYANRKAIWTRDVGERIVGEPVVFEELVCVATADGLVVAYGMAEKPVWTLSLQASLADGPTRSGDALFLGAGDGRVHVLEARKGVTRWTSSTPLPEEIVARPFVNDQAVFAASTDGTVACFDRKGAEVWRLRPGAGIRAGILAAGGLALVGDMRGDFHALRATDGRPQWRYATARGLPIRTAAATVDSRVIFVGEDRTLYVLPLD